MRPGLPPPLHEKLAEMRHTGLMTWIAHASVDRVAIAAPDASLDRTMMSLLMEELGVEPALSLLDFFLGDAERRLAEMRALIAGGDGKALQCAAHTLQSSAATFGFCRLAGLAGVIETQAANGAPGLGGAGASPPPDRAIPRPRRACSSSAVADRSSTR